MQNTLITGIPRGGLTVVSALLDTLPGSVCLNAPSWQTHKATQITQAVPYCKWLAGDFLWQRQRILAKDPVRDFRAQDGKPLLDGLHDKRAIRDDKGELGHVAFTRGDLEKDFVLSMKHHTLYTALLPELLKFDFWQIVAVIRHPFDVIASWQKQKSYLPDISPEWWPELYQPGTADINPLEHMVQLYETYCQRYWELRDKIIILKFEDVIKDPTTVSLLTGQTAPSPATRLLEQRTRILMREETEQISRLFAKNGVFTKHFYDV